MIHQINDEEHTDIQKLRCAVYFRGCCCCISCDYEYELSAGDAMVKILNKRHRSGVSLLSRTALNSSRTKSLAPHGDLNNMKNMLILTVLWATAGCCRKKKHVTRSSCESTGSPLSEVDFFPA